MTPREAATTGSGRESAPFDLPGPILAGLYLLAIGMPLALAGLSDVPPDTTWGEAATAVGSVALAAMVVQFLTSGRFETFAGRVGIDVTMAFHKWAARWILIGVVLHPLLYIAPTALADPGRGLDRLLGMVTAPRLTTGVVAFVATVLIVALGFLRARLPVRYETWRASHGVLALVAVAGGIHHALSAGNYAGETGPRLFWFAAALMVAGAVALLYGVRWWSIRRRPWRLTEVRPIGDKLWELELEPEPGTPPLRYRAGQFVWMTVAPRIFPLFDHPFSIASSPTRPGVKLIIKEIGDFTRTVGRIPSGTAVGLDGPHGNFTVESHDADAVVLVAGGVGIAPVLGVLRDLAARRDSRPVRLLYGAANPDRIVGQDDIADATRVIDLHATFVVETAPEGWTGAVGSIDRTRLASTLDGLDPSRTLALVCGPDGMITSVADQLFALGLPVRNVVYERFDYGGGSKSRADVRMERQFAAVGLVLAATIAVFAFR